MRHVSCESNIYSTVGYSLNCHTMELKPRLQEGLNRAPAKDQGSVGPPMYFYLLWKKFLVWEHLKFITLFKKILSVVEIFAYLFWPSSVMKVSRFRRMTLHNFAYLYHDSFDMPLEKVTSRYFFCPQHPMQS